MNNILSVLKKAIMKNYVLILSFRYVTSFDDESFSRFEDLVEHMKPIILRALN